MQYLQNIYNKGIIYIFAIKYIFAPIHSYNLFPISFHSLGSDCPLEGRAKQEIYHQTSTGNFKGIFSLAATTTAAAAATIGR